MKKRFFSLILIISILVCLCSCSATTVNFDNFDGRFSPFFALREADLSVTDMVHETILVTDPDNGGNIMNAYDEGIGIANITLDDSDKTKLVCTIEIGKDVTFSDGTPVTADDVIFSMYVYADNDYEGWSAFGISEIDGLKNYKYNNSLAENIALTEQQLDKALENPDEELTALIKEKIIHPILEDEYKWIMRAYDDAAYVGTEIGQYMGIYPEAKDLFAYLYSIDENYDSKNVESGEQVLEDIKKQYGIDYKTLSDVIGEIDLTATARRCAEEVTTRNMLEATGGEAVENIRGIEKVDEHTVRVTINSQEDNQFRSTLGIYVAPLHHYGNKAQYDYENNKFGFTRNDLDSVREKNEQPLGAGRYLLKEYKDGKTVTFKENKNCYIKNSGALSVTFKATGNSAENKLHEYYTNYENYTASR
ncbi:MAG: hypothetical protein IJ408_00020 [Clostridia bacterium]|nr:hypothetical protein [Clostridia bacterium]